MAENPIKNTDFYDGNGKPFEEVVKNILELEEQVAKLTASIKESVKALKQMASATDSKSIKLQADETFKLEKASTELAKVEQQRIKTQLELEKATKLKIQADALAKANIEKLNDAQQKELGTLEKLTLQNKQLTAEKKKLNLETEEGRKRLREINDQLNKNNQLQKEHGTAIQQQQSNYFKWGTQLRDIGLKFTAMLGIIGGGTAIFEGFKKIMNSTAAGADQLEFGLKAVGGALQGALQSIQNGDWSNFFDNIINGAKAAYDLAEGLDAVEDRENALRVVQSKTLARQAELEVAYKNANLSVYQQRAALAELLKIQKEESEQNKKVIDDKVALTERDILTRAKITKGELEYFIQLRATNLEIEKQADYLNQLAKETKEIASQTATGQIVTRTVFTERAIKAQQVLLNNEKDFAKFANIKNKLESKYNSDQIKNIQDLYVLQGQTNAAFEADNVKRLTKQNKFESEIQEAITKKQKEELEKRAKQQEDFDKGRFGRRTQPNVIGQDLNANSGLNSLLVEQTAADQTVEIHKNLLDNLDKLDASDAERKVKQAKWTENKKQALIKATFDAAYGLTETLGNFFESQKNRELQAAGNNAKKKEEIERKYAKKEQKLAISRAIITGAEAVLYASLLPPPANWISASLAATMVAGQVALIASQKFAKGGTWVEGGRLHSEGGNRYGDKELERGEQVSVFSRSATSKHNELITEFTNAINHDKLDLFSLNFAPKHVVVQQTDKRLVQLAEKQLQAQLKLNDNISNMPIISGNKTITKQGIRYVV